jgi:hypothetical protein
MVSTAAVPERELARKTRSDFGSFKASDRDKELLGLVAEQYALTLPQLARLIGRAPHTARWLRDRWVRAGWVASGQLAVGLPPFVWLTVRGSRLAESDYRTWDANPGLARHIQAVSEVRLLVERALRLGWWICERALAKASPSRSEARPHHADGVLVREGKRIAVEVELGRKSSGRLRAILDDLCQRHEQVWYFAPAEIGAVLRDLLAETPWRNVRVSSYPPLSGEVLGRAA